jgi:hypothetical protein
VSASCLHFTKVVFLLQSREDEKAGAGAAGSTTSSSRTTANQALGLTEEEINAPIKELNKMLKLKGFSKMDKVGIKAKRRTRNNR